ncbi:MAG: VOC family protein [Pseudomonadota bacterium]|nr:MAG: glyoxalase [Pseudomonadota bacterium]
MVEPIPDGYHSLTPFLVMKDAAKAMAFYEQALGAKELYRFAMPNGKIAHAEMQIGDSRFMLADEAPEFGAKSLASIGGSPIGLHVYTENVDALAERFVKAGGVVVRPVENKFYGDRSGDFRDPEGYQWTLSQHVEDVSPEEMERRMKSQKG